MKSFKKLFKFSLLVPAFILVSGCTKLDQNLGSTLTSSQASTALGANGTGLLLQAAYNDLTGVLTGQDQVFSLEENSSDESLVPTRGGDWDDNGVWRVIHNHTWNADHSQVLSVFNNLNKLNFDATNVLAFSPTPAQAAQAKFLRCIALYYLLDLYGQFPFRNPGDNLLNPPNVKSGADAASFIISELNAALPNIPTSKDNTVANPDAVKMLLMHALLQKGAWGNPANPTFADADMQQVITLGNQIITGGNWSFTPKYFDNFSYNNTVLSKENVFVHPNTTGVSVNNGGATRWMMTLHYNSYGHSGQGVYGNAGWNGFSTISDFYNSFNPNQSTSPFVYGPADTTADTRLGGRVTHDLTKYSGLRAGFLVGQQYDETGAPRVDRKSPANPLAFTPAIASNMIETGNNLELTGIRVIKYTPDFSDPTGTYYSTNPGNDLAIFRYPDVLLMVAEAKLRAATPDAAGALALVNQIRTARGAAPFTSISLNTSVVDDPANPNTIIGERGRELYWESFRRTDLIRFGLFNKIWLYKPSDDPKYLLFPVPNQALAANPNLKQNAGY